MAATSNSDDTSDIFWPGYVDAVTNLAINLLFVIAVMSIVVLAAILQISELSKKKTVEGETPTNNSAPASPDFTLAQLEEKLQMLFWVTHSIFQESLSILTLVAYLDASSGRLRWIL